MTGSASIFMTNPLVSEVMRKVIIGLSLVLLLGCEGYSVELDPTWEPDNSDVTASDPTLADPDTTDPTDTEGPTIELDFDDESEPDDTEPDEVEPSSPDPCQDYICPSMGAFCFDEWSVQCCSACDAGVRTCHEDFSQGTHSNKLVCAGGCWEYEDDCEWGTYCKEDSPGQLSCTPLPLEPDAYCDPTFEWADPDCQTCDPCMYPDESYCDQSGSSPDILVGCYDVTGYGYNCWLYEFCGSGTSQGFCVEDFARNYATCVVDEMPDTLCSEFICTGATICDPDGSGSEADCGYCNTCCDTAYQSLCGYSGPSQNVSAILTVSADGSCFEPLDCNDESGLETGINRCRITDFGEAVCEPLISGP